MKRALLLLGVLDGATANAAAKCGPPTADFYAPPAALAGAAPGTILRCETMGQETAGQLTNSREWRMSAPPGTAAGFGLAHLRILYASQGASVVSATVYLPIAADGKCAPLAPVAAVQHGTTGIADVCAPSRDTFAVDYMAMALVGRGMAVVATDYQGLGTPGVHPYLVGESEAYSVLDGIRALAQLAEPGCLGRDVVMVGHSQGGQASLFAEQYAASYGMGPGLRLGGVVVWAPAFGTRLVPKGVEVAVPPQTKTSNLAVFYAMYLFAASRYRGAPPDAAWLAPGAVKALPALLEQECALALFNDLPAKFPTLGSLFSAEFLKDPGAEPWSSYVDQDVAGGFHTEVPTLIVQGRDDTLVPPATVGCIADRMTARKDRVDTCVLRGGHISVVAASWKSILPWIEAAARGEPPAAPGGECAGVLPACGH